MRRYDAIEIELVMDAYGVGRTRPTAPDGGSDEVEMMSAADFFGAD